MVFVRLVFGVCRAILAGLRSHGGETGVFRPPKSIGRAIGEAENRWIGKAQSGITISTCLDLILEESPTHLRPGRGKFEMLGRLLETIVEVLDELSPAEVQGLPGATIGA